MDYDFDTGATCGQFVVVSPGKTFDTMESAVEGYQKFWCKWHPERPYRFFEHDEPLCQELATCTFDFKVFHFGGMIRWPKSREGELLRGG